MWNVGSWRDSLRLLVDGQLATIKRILDYVTIRVFYTYTYMGICTNVYCGILKVFQGIAQLLIHYVVQVLMQIIVAPFFPFMVQVQ